MYRIISYALLSILISIVLATTVSASTSSSTTTIPVATPPAISVAPNPVAANHTVNVSVTSQYSKDTLIIYINGTSKTGAAGNFSVNYIFKTAGTYAIKVQDTNTSLYSQTVNLIVQAIPVIIPTLSVSPNPANTNQNVTITGRASGDTVDLVINGGPYNGIVSGGTSTDTISRQFNPGTYTIQAWDVNDNKYSSSVNLVVNQTSITNAQPIVSATPNPAITSQNVTITAQAPSGTHDIVDIWISGGAYGSGGLVSGNTTTDILSRTYGAGTYTVKAYDTNTYLYSAPLTLTVLASTTSQSTSVQTTTTPSTSISGTTTPSTTTLTTVVATTVAQYTTQRTTSATTTIQSTTTSSRSNILQQVWNAIVNFFKGL